MNKYLISALMESFIAYFFEKKNNKKIKNHFEYSERGFLRLNTPRVFGTSSAVNLFTNSNKDGYNLITVSNATSTEAAMKRVRGKVDNSKNAIVILENCTTAVVDEVFKTFVNDGFYFPVIAVDSI